MTRMVHHVSTPWFRARAWLATMACCLLTACAPHSLHLAPHSPIEPWRPPAPVGNLHAEAASQTGGYVVPYVPSVAELPPAVQPDPQRAYALSELIDLGQRNNPLTRLAWNQAREAALAVGAVEATFLPTLSANVIGGYQRTRYPLPIPIEADSHVDTSVSGVVPALTLQWLVFDFGQRDALLAQAREASFAANVLFNGTHQTVIHEVTRTYHQYGASRAQAEVARQTLRNSQAVATAVQERRNAGLATVVELAQARQLVAQAELRRVQAEGQERDAYQALLAAAGLSPTARIRVADSSDRALPTAVDLPEELIRTALAQRPDVLAAYAGAQAARAGIDAARAAFMPKVYLAGVAAHRNTRFDVGALSGLDQRAASSGVLVGMTLPLYDAGLRASRLQAAETQADSAARTFERTQQAALREMVVAADALRSALQAHQAATTLIEAASITYDAALDSYRSGVGTVTVATEAANGLLDAGLAQIDAHAAARIAAADLAFAMGRMTSADAVWAP